MATPAVREVLQGIAVGAGLDLTIGAGTEAGDLLLVTHSTHFYTLADMDPPTPGVWTLVTQADDGADRVKTKVWQRLAGSAGAETITLPPVNDTHSFGRLRVLAGVDQADPVDAAAGANGFGNAAQQDAPSVSPTSVDALLCCDWICDQERTYSAPVGMTPSGTQLQDFSTAFGAHEALAASGPTGVRTATLTGDASFAATSVAIRGSSTATAGRGVGLGSGYAQVTAGKLAPVRTAGHGGGHGMATPTKSSLAAASGLAGGLAEAVVAKVGSGAPGHGAGGTLGRAVGSTVRHTRAAALGGGRGRSLASRTAAGVGTAYGGGYGAHRPAVVVTPGILTPGSIFPALVPSAARPGLAAGATRPVMTSGRSPSG